jgi:DNA primase
MKGLVSVRLSVSDRTLLEQAVQRYEANLEYVQEYLAGRGIPQAIARTYRLGYVAEPTPGLGDDEYVGRLAIPYLSPSGVVDIRYRIVSQSASGPKYISRPGSTVRLFGVNALAQASTFIGICEGEIDTIIANTAGIPSVGVPGASNWAKHYPLLFEGFQRVFVFCDGDQAGRDFGKKVISTLDQAVMVTMPEGMDVNDVYRAEGPDGLTRRAGISE